MHTIKFLLQKASEFLSVYNISAPRLDSEIILQHVLEKNRTFLISNDEISITTKQEECFWNLIKKRSQYFPISQIIGRREFYGLDFIVNQNVLDPRPDSEILIEKITSLQQFNHKQNLKIADLGCGSGCLLISLLHHYKNAIGIGFEKSQKAYRTAVKNIKNHKMQGRTSLFFSSWNNCRGNFDIIISNPPYIRRSIIKKLQPEVKLHEPKTALDGGVTGLDCYTEIFKIIKRCLKKTGFAILEIGESQEKIEKLLGNYGLRLLCYQKDLSKKKRCIVLRKQLFKKDL